MENITCSLDVQLTDNEDSFGKGWDFTISVYQFQKISDSCVRITFSYDDEVTRRDPDGVLVTGHNPWAKEYIQIEENLQTLLDLICFQTSGIGLKIVPDSLEMRSNSMISHRSEQSHQVSLRDHDDIQARFETTIKNANEELMDALRLSRLAANEENDGEKIGQLWGAIERLYANNPPRVLSSKEKREEIQAFIDRAKLIDDEDKERLKNTMNNTYKVSKPSVIAEKFDLISGNGEAMTTEQVKQKLDYWLNTRSIQSHGMVLMRNHDVNMLANEMSHIMETALSAEIKPSKFVYVLYKPDDVGKDFLSSQRTSTKQDENSRYLYTPIHRFAAFNDMADRLRHSLKDESSELYIVEYKSITKTTRNRNEVIALKNLNVELQELVKKLGEKLAK